MRIIFRFDVVFVVYIYIITLYTFNKNSTGYLIVQFKLDEITDWDVGAFMLEIIVS